MRITKAKSKSIFAVGAIFIASLLSGIFTLPISASAATDDYNSRYTANTKVGYYAEYLDTVERQKPEVKNEGFATVFPKYGTTLYGEETSSEKSALWQENGQLLSDGLANISGASYDGMDKDGNLYLKGEPTGRALYRHEASADMYYGNVSDNEPAVVKKISYRSRTYGNLITGLYAPAGEVLTLTMDKADFEASGGLKVFIGQAFSDGSANVIASRNAYNRMPCIVNAMNLVDGISTLEINEESGTVTGYFGSFLGGPVYIAPVNGGSTFTVTLSGGVRYSHFILGYTTEDEFKANAASTAPYFDLEVWDRGVRHSGPQKYAEKYTYSQLYNAAVFWEEVASLANQFPKRSTFNSSYGINFIYDTFVTTQLVPQNTLNCPDAWLSAALDYDAIVKDGCHDILNKYNSRFISGWGLTNDGASNDAITLIAYSLYTDISSKRNIQSEDEGLDGLTRNSSASLSLKQLKGERENDLAVHATIIHSFGQDLFIKAVKEDSRYSQSTDRWFKSLVEVTKHDMTYYFTELCKIEISQETLDWVKEKNYPMFVPSACVYQTGAGYELNGESAYIRTMQPYVIEYGTQIEIDFDKVLELPYGFSYKINRVTQPENGSISKLNSHTYNYIPARSKAMSGKIYVSISIERDDKRFEVEDKILILEFKQYDEGSSDSTFVGDHRYKDLNNAETVEGISGFTRFSPDGLFTGSVGLTAKQAQSTFGHIYEGEQGSALEFTFYGTQFAVYSRFAESLGEFEIYIDGGKTPVKTVKLGSKNEIAGLAYLSSTLTAGSHTVKISGISGTFNIDSISLRLLTDPSTLPEIPDLTPDAESSGEDFRKPLDHPDDGNQGGGGGNSGGQDTPGGGKDHTGLIVGLSVGGAALIAAGGLAFIIIRKKRNGTIPGSGSDLKSSE
ncbi:MAG: hypothetical protein J1G05_03080 [Clostridiales bacterium]|nr:hypothetical protein [Clostridiales bacterium]